MGRIILVYGAIAGLIVAALMHLTFWLLPVEGGAMGMFIGYTGMLIAFSMILVGIKQHRDQALGGVITFKRGLVIGLGIAVIAALFYVAAWELYLALSGRDYMGEYTAKMIAEARASGDPAKLSKAMADAKMYLDMYANPFTRMAATMVEILPVGIVVALVCAILLKNPRFLPAREPVAQTFG